MTRLTIALPALFFIACGGPKDVSPDALSSVPASAVTELANLRTEVDDAEVQLRRAHERVDDLEGQLKSARSAADEANVSLEKTRAAKADAVLSGNAQLAGGLDEDMAASQKRRDARADSVARLEKQLAIAKQAVEVRKQEVEWRDARLELARAEAAATGGADVDVERYRKAATDERADYDDAVAQAEALNDN
jgi:chromosome segregation ATPase